MTAGDPGGRAAGLHIGVVLEAFLDWPLERVLGWLPEAAPEVTHLEIGAGGYAPHPHCDVAGLLASGQARSAWLTAIARPGLQVDALNAWGNPLHPDQDLARAHDQALRDAIRLATLLGVNRVVALAGCPGGTAGDQVPRLRGRRLAPLPGGRLPAAVGGADRALLGRPGGVRRRREPRTPRLPGVAPRARACSTSRRSAGWPRSVRPSRATSTRATSSGWAWTVTGSPRSWVTGSGTCTARTPVFHAESLALNGLLDRRWPEPAAEMPWTFAVPGRGHDLAWWAGLVRALGGSAARVISIEHEDPFVPATIGVPEAARLLRSAIDRCPGSGVRPSGSSRVRVGLVGTGVIAQVMHLHYLAELADRFEVAAVCDLDADGVRACAERYGIPAVFTDWRDLLGHPLDAVMVLTSGSHAPIAEAAARAGLHVFVEKPMCFSADEGRAMVAAAERAGVKLMVGYPKRYDPAFARMREETVRLTGARLLRVTTFESPLRPYIEHYPLLPGHRFRPRSPPGCGPTAMNGSGRRPGPPATWSVRSTRSCCSTPWSTS